MPCEDKIERRCVDGPVDLHLVRINQGLQKEVLIALMGGGLMV